MELVAVITVLALLQYVWFGLQVGQMRGRHKVKAPAMSGAPEFDRAFRIHMNTIEQLVLFVPLLWLSTSVLGDPIAAGVGAIWIVGRVVYANAYSRDAAGRGPGMIITILSTGVLALATLWGIVRAFMA